MKLYEDYLESKNPGEGFTSWLLIRKMTFKQQAVIIFILIASWLYVAPSLVFWLFFFKSALVLGAICFILHLITKWRMRLGGKS